MVKIIVTKRADDFHACLEGHPEHWEAGRTKELAVFKLIRCHPPAFGLEIIDQTLAKSSQKRR